MTKSHNKFLQIKRAFKLKPMFLSWTVKYKKGIYKFYTKNIDRNSVKKYALNYKWKWHNFEFQNHYYYKGDHMVFMFINNVYMILKNGWVITAGTFFLNIYDFISRACFSRFLFFVLRFCDFYFTCFRVQYPPLPPS